MYFQTQKTRKRARLGFHTLAAVLLVTLCACASQIGGPTVYEQYQAEEIERLQANKHQQRKHRERLAEFEKKSFEELEKLTELTIGNSLNPNGVRNRRYAQYELGRRYEFGIGVEKDLGRAISYYRVAIEFTRQVRHGPIMVKIPELLSFDAREAIDRAREKRYE